jgi:hypothetical protein
MAEFKLGRIRFVWKGTWSSGQTYLIDDVVSNGGKSYICVVNHTSSGLFDTDLDFIPTKWNIVSDGTQWLGDWEPETYYNPGAVIKYGGLIYICNTGHTSATNVSPTFLGLEDDLEKWDLFAESFNWEGSWTTSRKYLKNDFVVYGGTTYVCTEGHISDASATAGLEADDDKWDTFNQGVIYLGNWNASSIRYKVNDLVKYGANLWICTEYHTSSASFDESKWDMFVEGFEFENSWNNSTVYQPGDVVTYGGYSYISKTNHTNKQPTTNALDWAVFTTGFNFRGEWAELSSYRVGDTVRRGAYTYVALLDSVGTDPTNGSYWALLNSGFKWTNVPQTYTEVSAVTVTGIGSGAKFNVTRSSTVYTVVIAPGFSGVNYQAGDKIKILGSSLGGISPANDVTITINTVATGAIATFTSAGGSVTWTATTDYILGDVVTFGASSYICIDAHTASLSNRPDADENGEYWNLIAAGSELNILTDTGDLVYYGANGPTRLPVGINGQVLRSQDGFPIWANYGLINNLVYVGPLGSDIPYPAAGATIDQPWKSVRYAAKQVEEGYLTPNAKVLLAKNKQFVMKEVTAWISYTYTFTVTEAVAASDKFVCNSTANLTANMPIVFNGTIGGVTAGTVYYIKTILSSTDFTISNQLGGTLRQINDGLGSMTGTLSYDSVKCERDVGMILEAIKYDVSHGGTMKTTAAAKSYFTPAGSAYITSNFGTQTVQTIAAYSYMATVVENVLTNSAFRSYQVFNGVDDGIIQSIDTTLVSEPGVVDKVYTLVGIITTALDLGSVTAIPNQLLPATTISVKTGTFNEVLPIVIPEYVAVVGDELRSTVIQPAAANSLLVNDKEKTTTALERINAVAADLIQNNAVTATVGNNESQQYIGGFVGSTVITTDVGTKIGIAESIKTGGTVAAPAISLTDPTSYDTGYFNARRLLVSNKVFLQSEISAWIAAQVTAGTPPFNGFVYTAPKEAACELEVGYIIDALRYDITYSGNLETVAAAREFNALNAFVEVWGNQNQALAIYQYLKSIISYIAEGDNSGWTKTPANSELQDDSGTPGSADAGEFLEERLQEICDTIEFGNDPVAIEPLTTWVDEEKIDAKNAIIALKAGIQNGVIEYINTQDPGLSYDEDLCYTGIGRLVDAVAYDVMFGSNFRTISASIKYEVPSLLALSYTETAIVSITTGQVGSVGSTTAVQRIETNADIIYDIVASGNGVVPTLVLPNPTGFDTNYLNARTQIVNNYAFIRAEIAQFLNVNYNSVWVSLGATGQAGCARDIGYILDGVRYDITYGGNTQSLIVGSAYYSNFALTIEPGEITATVAAYTRLKTIIGQIAQRQAVTVTPGNAVSQDLSGTGGNPASATFAQARVQDVIDWIEDEQAPATIAPSITWADSALQVAFNELQNKKTEIVADVVWWVYKNHQDLNFNEELCSRDTGYLVDALSYDMVFGSNFASITAGRAYNRATPSAIVVSTEQLLAELGAINFLKYKAKHIAAAGGVAQVDAIVSDIIGYINGGSMPRIQYTSPTTITSAYEAAAVLLNDNKEFIKAEILAWLDVNYPAIVYNEELCARDVGYILDALRYDLVYGYGVGALSNTASKVAGLAYYSGVTLQIDAGDKTATLAAYARLKTVAQAVIQNTDVTESVGNTVPQVRAVTGQTVGSVASATSLGTLVDVITTIIDQGPILGVPSVTVTTIASGTTFTTGSDHGLQVGDLINPKTGTNGLVTGTTYYVASTPLTTTFTLAAVYGGTALTTFTNGTGLSISLEKTNSPSTAWVSAALQTQFSALQLNRADTIAEVSIYINDNYPNLVYNTATCERDVGLIIDAVGYDMMFESNYRTTTAVRRYFSAAASEVLGEQKAATVAAFRYLKTQLLAIVVSNSTAYRRVKWLMDIVIDVLSNGIGSTSEVTGTITYKNDVGLFNSAEILRLNKDFLANEATAWITQSYGGTVTATTASTDQFTTSTAHNLTVGDPVIFTGSIIANSGINSATTYFVLATPTPTTFTVATTSTSISPVNITADNTGTMTVRYSFDVESCKRDMREYVEAIIYDLSYTGNYRSLRAAELYLNAVNGSQLSNMFYVSNATGLRNCTLNGLNGTLTEENEYGTKRPTAGAYVALNPGFGPNDSSVWVNTRSHYSQNVSLFGTGCSGAKIDGALHAGGNRSMVKNDFTTIISDGIGVWCTGANSLTELVSVFAYYSYAGYLADLGGRIRATNGNSSYGSFGTIAEGTDTYEVPIRAVVDNHSQQAVISEVVGDADNVIWRVEYSNAGTNYTNYDIGISGDGVNALTRGDEFRDGGVFETRIYDLDNGEEVGGTNYINAINAAQGGEVGAITIAATDVQLSTAYVGMRIQITAGTGVGQYANILTYSNGTKIAQIYKDSFETLTVTATATTNNLLTVASTATLTPGTAIYLGSSANGVSANTVYYVRTANFSATQFSVSLTGAAGTAVTITATGSVSIPLYAAGWDHVVPGTTIANALDLTTGYIIEPRISYTHPGYTATARTLPTTQTWKALEYGVGRYLAIAGTGTATAYSSNGQTWTAGGALSTSASWTDLIFGGGYGATATAVVGGLGGEGAVLEAIMGTVNSIGAPGVDQVVGVRIINGGRNYTSPPTIVFTPVSGGAGAVAICTVLDGKIDAVYLDPINYEGTVNGSGYTVAPTVTAVTDRVTKLNVDTWGRRFSAAPTVTITPPVNGSTTWSNGGSAVSGSYYVHVNTTVSPTITNYYQAQGNGTFSSSPPMFTTGTGLAATYGVDLLFVGQLAEATANLTTEGVSSLTISNTGRGYTSVPTVTIVDPLAKFVAIANGSTSASYLSVTSASNANWTASGALPATTFVSLAYGIAGGVGVYVAVGGTAAGASSSAGITWTSRTLPTLGAGTYSAVTYGADRFVAISTGNNATAYSTNGSTWVAGGTLPSSTTWTSVAYGNGRFVAIASGGRSAAYSLNGGVNWTAVSPGLPTSVTWNKISYGQGKFFAIASGTATCATSPDGINWTVRAMPSSSNWSDIVLGNTNNNPLWVAVSNTSGSIAASIRTGARALGRMEVNSGTVTEVRMIEPGSGYPKGTVTATTESTNLITVDNTVNLVGSQPIIFANCSAGGLVTEKLYYVIGSTITSTQFKVSLVAGSSTPVVLSTVTGLTGTYRAAPIITQVDPNKVVTAALNPRTNDGVLANPTFVNRGASYTTATADASGDGFADLYQPSTFIAVRNLHAVPQAGSNVVFGSLTGTWYKLVAVSAVLGDPGDYTATFQISPGLSVLEAPIDGDSVTTTIKYSQVRLTGHDFLYIGTGNQADTNYPFVDPTTADINAQTKASGGGRCFFTSTDQDGNFNVGGLFGVQQSTGTATLNADAFNLSGLQSLQLGALNIGVGSAVITQFSTDPYFTANSDNILSTQRAIKAYITAQIGGGQSSLNVNTLTAGVVYIANDSISTTSGGQLNIKSKMNFTGGIDGAPVALGFFLSR